MRLSPVFSTQLASVTTSKVRRQKLSAGNLVRLGQVLVTDSLRILRR